MMIFLASFMFISTVITFVIVLLWYRQRFRYWKNKGVQGPKPTILTGNMTEMFTMGNSIGIQFKELYEKTKHLPFAGCYIYHRPMLLVNDLDMIKTIMIKDFAHFTDHGININAKTQPIANHLFMLNGARWRALRYKIAPVFTSNKMKYMFNTMIDCGVEMQNYLKEDADIGAPVDIKEIIAKYSTDIIASCAFGVDSNCFKHPDAEFSIIGREIFDFKFKRALTFILFNFEPKLQNYFDLKLIEDHVEDFFIKAVSETVKHREVNNIERNDLMQLLIRLKNNESIEDDDEKSNDSDIPNVEISNIDLAALAFGFFVGGFETISTSLSFILYDLAKYPDIQTNIRNEIDRVFAKYNDKITYEAFNEMTYMAQAMEESLRIHAPFPNISRECTKDYTIPGTDILIEKGTPVIISTLGIHMDPNVYPDPEKYDPSRFSAENKAANHHLSYLTFGDGPRMCIGNRFAILEMKIALFFILKRYEVNLVGDGKLNVTKNSFVIQPKDLRLKLTKRS